MKDPKVEIVEEAIALITGQRADDYGDAVETHNRIAVMYHAATGQKIEGADVATMLMCVKMVRMNQSKAHRDSHADLIGYAGIRWACEKAE